jgi:hypothetical protein
MSQGLLIDFSEFSEDTKKDTIWDIENAEKLQLIDFIETRLMSRFQTIINDKNSQIHSLENKVIELQEQIIKLEEKIERPQFDLFVSEDIRLQEEIYKLEEKTDCRFNAISNMLIPFNTCPTESDSYIQIGCEELTISPQYTPKGAGGYNDYPYNWEQINSLYKLKKLKMSFNNLHKTGHPDYISLHQEMTNILTKIKNQTITELSFVCCFRGTGDPYEYYDTLIPIILRNFPELLILEISDHIYNIDRFTAGLSSNKHKLKTIYLKQRKDIVGMSVGSVELYCVQNNIELIYRQHYNDFQRSLESDTPFNM